MGEMLIGIKRKKKGAQAAAPGLAQPAMGQREADGASADAIADDAVGLTPAAAQAIIDKAAAEARPRPLLRIGIRGGGCSGLTYHFGLEDEAKERDQLFVGTTARGAEATVCIDPKSLQYLGGTLLDFEEALGASSFRMRNPHVKSACSCGDSFSI